MSTTASSIEWTGRTWNPLRGCSRVSPGCVNCYAEKMATRFSRPGLPFHGFADRARAGSKWTGRVELIPEALAEPLSWRKPTRVFVNSMSDLFHEGLSDETIEDVFAIMAFAPQHTFQILTKRAGRMRQWSSRPDIADRMDDARERVIQKLSVGHRPGGFMLYRQRNGIEGWPLPNVWLGVSVEDQHRADERVPLLLKTPAAVRFLSVEPLLGPVDLNNLDDGETFWTRPAETMARAVDWVIVGGESGPGARPMSIEWARSIVEQCRDAQVPVFVKQMGSVWARAQWAARAQLAGLVDEWDRKGGDQSEWPPDLRIREFPEGR